MSECRSLVKPTHVTDVRVPPAQACTRSVQSSFDRSQTPTADPHGWRAASSKILSDLVSHRRATRQQNAQNGAHRPPWGRVCIDVLHAILAETAVLPAMKSVSRRRPACLPIVHIYCAVVVAIVVESTKGVEYYCSTPREPCLACPPALNEIPRPRKS